MADKSVVQLEIQSLLDGEGFDEAKDQLKQLGINLEKTGREGEYSLSRIDTQTKKTGKSFLELKTKITTAYNAIKGMLDAYIGDAQAAAKMQLALKNNTTALERQGKSVSTLTKEYKEFASAQQEATGIGDEVTLSLMGTLTALGTMPKDLKRVTAALQDMEAATGTSADSMARAWARLQEAPEEALGALSRVGIKIRKEQLDGMAVEQQRIFILEKLEKAFGGQAQAMAEATGGIAQAKAAFGDFQEVLGKIVTTIFGPFIRGITQMMSFFNNASGPAQALIIGLGALGFAFLSLRTAGITSFAALSTAVKGFFASLGPIGWAATALGTIATVIGVLGGRSRILEDTDEKIRSLAGTLDSLKSSTKNLSAINALLEKLKNAKRGGQEYNSILKKIIESNDVLKSSNLTVANSYVEVANKVRAASFNMNAAEFKKTLSTADSLIDHLGDVWEAAQDLKDKQDVLSKKNYQAHLTTIAQGMLQLKRLDEALFLEDKNNPATFSNRLKEITDELEHPEKGKSRRRKIRLMFISRIGKDVQRRYTQIANASETKEVAPVTSESFAISDSKAQSDTKVQLDLWKKRIELIDDEFARRRVLATKEYCEEGDEIDKLYNDKKIKEEEKNEALSLAGKKYVKELAKIEREENEKLKEERIKAYNEALSLMQQGMSIGTSIIKKDWKSALGSTLSMIPGVGQTLSSVFGTAVDFFGSIFGSRSKTEAERLGEWLEAAVKKFDASFVRSETYSKLFGNLDQTAVEAEIDSVSESLKASLVKLGLDPNASRKEFKAFYDKVFDTDFRKVNWDDYSVRVKGQKRLLGDNRWMKLDQNKETTLNIFRTNKNDPRFLTKKNISVLADTIRKFFSDMYGEYAPKMMEHFGLTGRDSQIWHKWMNGVKNKLSQINDKVHDVAKQSAEWFDRLESAQLKKGLASTKDELERINKKFEIGEMTQKEMVKRSTEQIEKALEYLRTLEPTREVQDAIDDLLLQQINLQKKLNDESAKGLNIEDEKLRNLLAQREELERNIQAGYVRGGTVNTVAQQASILRQIITRAKEIGMSRDDYFQYEKVLADLMESFAGSSSYMGRTGFGYTPDVEDFVGVMPIGSREYQNGVNAARMSQKSISNINTTTQNIVINGQVMTPNQEFVDGLRALTRRVYGKDIIK